MPTRFIGDVHGKFGRYKTILNNSPHPTIQVGDMGVGFKSHVTGDFSANPPFDLMVEKEARFIRGNHDNPEVCREHKRCIPDGQVEDNMMFIGGALSIDAAYRIKDCSWWADEELSQNRLDQMVIEMQFVEPEIMVTHECPERIAEMVLALVPKVSGGVGKWTRASGRGRGKPLTRCSQGTSRSSGSSGTGMFPSMRSSMGRGSSAFPNWPISMSTPRRPRSSAGSFYNWRDA